MKDIECKEVIISTLTRRGKGVEGDPIRRVLQVWDKSGELIAERDHIDKVPDLPFFNIHFDKLAEEVKNETFKKFCIDDEPEILAAYPDEFKG